MKGLPLLLVVLAIGLGAWLTPAIYPSVAATPNHVQSPVEGNFGVTDPELYRDAQPSPGCTQVQPTDGIVEASAGDVMVLVAQTKGQRAGIVSVFTEPSSERIRATGPIYLCDTLQHASDHARFAAAQIQ